VRSITIPVDVPQMHVVHSVRLNILDSSIPWCHPGPVAMGEAIRAELAIKHTRRWRGSSEAASSAEALEFCCEVEASPDTWIIGGQRRTCFTAREDEVKKFAIVMLPQRAGHLIYPNVDVRLVRDPEDYGGDGVGEMNCDIDYQNQGQSILVVPGVKSTTVALGATEDGSGGGWLVESVGRREA
jgi:trafficking protein particle complex subunit 10